MNKIHEIKTMDKLKALKLFITAVDTGSFAGAAKHYSTDPSTVSKAVQRLEDQLEIQLLIRSTRSLKLTEFGEVYIKTARTLVDQLHYCEESLKSDNDLPKGRLKINMPVSYGRLYIRPLMAEFCKLFPEIELELSYDDAYIDMIEQGIDVSIRSGALQDSGFIAQQLSPLDFLICASPEYIKDSHSFAEQSLSEHSWIRFRFRQSGRIMPIMFGSNQQRGSSDIEPRHYDPGQQIIVDDGEVLAELCADGLGLTQIPHFIAKNWLESGTLVPVFPYYSTPAFGAYLVYPKRDFMPRKTKCFIDFIKTKIQQKGETPLSTWARTWPVHQQ